MQMQRRALCNSRDAKFRWLNGRYRRFLRQQVCLVIIISSAFWSGLQLQGSVDSQSMLLRQRSHIENRDLRDLGQFLRG